MHNGSEWVTVQNETRVVLGLLWPAVLVSDTKPLRIPTAESVEIMSDRRPGRRKPGEGGKGGGGGGGSLREERELATYWNPPPPPPPPPPS